MHAAADEHLAAARAAGRPALICLYGHGGVGTTGAATKWIRQHRW